MFLIILSVEPIWSSRETSQRRHLACYPPLVPSERTWSSPEPTSTPQFFRGLLPLPHMSPAMRHPWIVISLCKTLQHPEFWRTCRHLPKEEIVLHKSFCIAVLHISGIHRPMIWIKYHPLNVEHKTVRAPLYVCHSVCLLEIVSSALLLHQYLKWVCFGKYIKLWKYTTMEELC